MNLYSLEQFCFYTKSNKNINIFDLKLSKETINIDKLFNSLSVYSSEGIKEWWEKIKKTVIAWMKKIIEFGKRVGKAIMNFLFGWKKKKLSDPQIDYLRKNHGDKVVTLPIPDTSLKGIQEECKKTISNCQKYEGDLIEIEDKLQNAVSMKMTEESELEELKALADKSFEIVADMGNNDIAPIEQKIEEIKIEKKEISVKEYLTDDLGLVILSKDTGDFLFDFQRHVKYYTNRSEQYTNRLNKTHTPDGISQSEVQVYQYYITSIRSLTTYYQYLFNFSKIAGELFASIGSEVVEVFKPLIDEMKK